MQWSELTWDEIPAVLANCGHAALLPVGATEQHGPHLGCGVDSVIAQQLCARVAEATGVPMLPTLPYGCSLGHSHRWPLEKTDHTAALQAREQPTSEEHRVSWTTAWTTARSSRRS